MTRGPGETDANAAPPAKPPACSCPRCGYDLSGHTSTWTSAWPLEGRCSECGLAFAWRDLIDPRRRRLGWLYEHNPWWRFDKAVGTALRALAPWSFWRHVTVECEARPSRIALFPCISWMCVHALFATILVASVGLLSLSGAFWNAYIKMGNGWNPWHPDVQEYVYLGVDSLLPLSRAGLYTGSSRLAAGPSAQVASAFLGWVAASSAVLLAVPSEWKTSRVRARLILRISAYSFAPLIIMGPAIGFLYAMATHPWATSEALSRCGASVTEIGKILLSLERVSQSAPTAALVFASAWLPCSHFFAFSRGLRLPSLVRLFPLTFGVGMLGAFTCMTVMLEQLPRL